MRFKTAVENTAELRDAWRRGLQALRNIDKQHVTAQDARRLAGSVDVDTALKDARPNEPRWDYAIGHRPSNSANDMIYWIEIHPASDGEVKGMMAKLQWLKTWLRENSPDLNSLPREFIWLSSGSTSLSQTSPQRKRLAQQGLQHRGRVFMIPN